MARNRVQFQKGYSLVQFMDEYGTEEQCMDQGQFLFGSDALEINALRDFVGACQDGLVRMINSIYNQRVG